MRAPLRPEPPRHIEQIEADLGYHTYVVTQQSPMAGKSWSRRVQALDLLDARKRFGSTLDPFAIRNIRPFASGDEHLETMR
jgi:hypothetical protein